MHAMRHPELMSALSALVLLQLLMEAAAGLTHMQIKQLLAFRDMAGVSHAASAPADPPAAPLGTPAAIPAVPSTPARPTAPPSAIAAPAAAAAMAASKQAAAAAAAAKAEMPGTKVVSKTKVRWRFPAHERLLCGCGRKPKLHRDSVASCTPAGACQLIHIARVARAGCKHVKRHVMHGRG